MGDYWWGRIPEAGSGSERIETRRRSLIWNGAESKLGDGVRARCVRWAQRARLGMRARLTLESTESVPLALVVELPEVADRNPETGSNLERCRIQTRRRSPGS
jgi:hypothetical protein